GLASAMPMVGEAQVTVGKFLGIANGATMIIGLVTEIAEEQAGTQFRTVAHLDLIGELSTGAKNTFQRGVAEYPSIGDSAVLMSERDLKVIYGAADKDRAHVGDLQQNNNVGVHVNID